MANLALPTPCKCGHEHEAPNFYFVLTAHHRLPSHCITECMEDSTRLYLLDQDRLPCGGNC